MLRRATIPAFSALLLVVWSCGPADRNEAPNTAARSVPAGDEQLLDLAALEALAPAEIALGEAWTFHDLTHEPTASGAGLELTRTGDRPRAVVEVDLDSAAVSALELQIDDLGAGRASVFWAGPEESFAKSRVLHTRSDGTDEAGRIRFDVASEAAWEGRISRLRLDLPIVAGRSAELRALAIIPAPDLLAPMTERSWAVALGRELRPATLATTTSPLRRSFVDRGGAVVAFGYGLLPIAGCDVTLEVSDRPADDAPGEVLLTHEVPAAEAGRWRSAEFRLPARDRSTIEIRPVAADGCVSSLVGLAVGEPRALGSPAGSRPSIVLVSVDTLRPDHLGLHGYPRDTSPNLDAWAKEEAVVFEDAWANAAWTLPSHASMFTGQTALRHGVNSRYPAPASLRTLAELLGEAGYRTAAWTGGSWLSPKYGLYQGFDEFRWWTRPDAGAQELETHVDEVAAWLESAKDRPVFLFFHTYEVHSPYRPRAPYYERFTDAPPLEPVTDRLLQPFREGGYLIRKRLEFADGSPVAEEDFPQVVAAYDSGIAFADAQLERLLEVIESRLGDDVVVLLTSDHGEALGEEGRVSHGRLEDEDLRIPWLLRLPRGRHAGTRVEARVSSVDIVPTLLELAGLAPDATFDGESVLRLLGDDARPSLTRPAVEAYAASSNLGLSLRLRNGGGFLFNDTPWAPKAERERLIGPGDPQLIQRLREEVERRLTEATGLHLLAWNGEPEPLELALVGPCVHPLSVKLTAPDDPELVWERPQHARWTVPPGDDMRIRFDTPIAPCVTVEVIESGEPAFRVDIDPRQPSASWHVGIVDGKWTRVTPGTATTTGLSAWLKGPVDPTFTDPTGDDEELMEQLRALGYLQ